MPVEIRCDIQRPTPDEFAALAYDVMACVFRIHNEIGRFFDERIFKQAVANRFGGIALEVPVIVSCRDFKKYCLEFLGEAISDWGTGLDLQLYDAAMAHVFGGDERVVSHVPITVDGVTIGLQKTRLTCSGAAFRVTGLYDGESSFEMHARRFLQHTSLPALHWVNITRQTVRVTTLLREDC